MIDYKGLVCLHQGILVILMECKLKNWKNLVPQYMVAFQILGIHNLKKNKECKCLTGDNSEVLNSRIQRL